MEHVLTVGVLGLQGAVREHVRAIEHYGGRAVVVKNADELAELDGLILPGGESTAIRRLIDKNDLLLPLQEFAKEGKPIFGTCAGLILLAKNVVGHEEGHLRLMDVTVERNSFGRQKDSFEAEITVAGVASSMTAVFIRAPHITAAGENVEVLAKYEGRIVAAREGQFLGCSFHPELTDDHRLTAYFIEMVKESLNKKFAIGTSI